LWQGIAGRLEPREAPAAPRVEETRVIPFAPRRQRWQPPRWALQAAAAVVLMAGSSLVTARLVRQAPAGPVATLPPAQAVTPRQGAAPAGDGTLAAAPDAR